MKWNVGWRLAVSKWAFAVSKQMGWYRLFQRHQNLDKLWRYFELWKIRTFAPKDILWLALTAIKWSNMEYITPCKDRVPLVVCLSDLHLGPGWNIWTIGWIYSNLVGCIPISEIVHLNNTSDTDHGRCQGFNQNPK